jgi:hypothetical protein
MAEQFFDRDEERKTPPCPESSEPYRQDVAAASTSGTSSGREIVRFEHTDEPASATTSTRDAADSESECGEVEQLEAQGFTEDEARRLIHISERLSTSHEARESEATLRRLRFTKWLIQHGMLDEFTA